MMEKNGKKSLFSIEITTGSLWKNILLFSLPLMMTQVLEVLFNLSDVAIAGKFADYLALGAVGSTTLLVSLFTGLLIGIGSGVNGVVARGLGLGSHEDVEKTIHTSLLICGGIGIVVCLVCLLLAKPMLLLLNTKEDLLPGMLQWPDNQDPGAWYYLAVQEATNSHTWKEKGEISEQWTELTEAPDWSRYET